MALVRAAPHLLLLLVRHRDRVVERAEILRAVWPDAMATDDSDTADAYQFEVVSLDGGKLLLDGDRRLPVDDEILTAERGSPLAAACELGGFRVGNRWCIHPMEGWDANRDGSPTEHVLRRWRNVGLSGANDLAVPPAGCKSTSGSTLKATSFTCSRDEFDANSICSVAISAAIGSHVAAQRLEMKPAIHTVPWRSWRLVNRSCWSSRRARS
mgnify:CR=1 FL=1